VWLDGEKFVSVYKEVRACGVAQQAKQRRQ
jgi:hypothetical protein